MSQLEPSPNKPTDAEILEALEAALSGFGLANSLGFYQGRFEPLLVEAYSKKFNEQYQKVAVTYARLRHEINQQKGNSA